ncbi:MAG: hypothetical protein AAF432_00795 [Planctomycetota bacterium]
MRISGSLPINVAQAYGLKTPNSAAPGVKTPPVQPAPPANPVSVQDPTPNVNRLVAGEVVAPVRFDGATTQPNATSAFQLYNRAADRIEAATAVAKGRQIDVTG